jgi:hypothetical protein
LACGRQSTPLDASVIPGDDAAARDAAATGDAGPRDPVCVGDRPDEAAWLAEPGPLRAPDPDGGVLPPDPDAGTGCLPRACIGADAPLWALRDFQPQSCGEGATYGLDVFRGKVTVVALLAAW